MNNSMGDDKTMASGGAGNGYALHPGDVLGQYRIVRQLGRGGMGQVYEVEHTTLGRRYALKLLPEDFVQSANALERFKREAKVMANLEHPNIIRVDDFGETDGQYWLRMELASGARVKLETGNGKLENCVTLAELAKAAGGKVPQEVLVPILHQILEGLSYAHAHGAVHRDLKPSNILLQASGNTLESSVAKIADFGLVKLVGEEWVKSMAEISVQRSMSMGDQPTLAGDGASGSAGTSTQSLLGTYEYMSPEQKRGEEADARSDIYSVGLMIYKLLTGEELGLRTPSQLDASLDKGWDELVLRALEARPEKRFQHVAEMTAALPTIDGCASVPKNVDAASSRVPHEKPVENPSGGTKLEASSTMKSPEAAAPDQPTISVVTRSESEHAQDNLANRSNATRQDATSTIKKKRKGWVVVLLLLVCAGGGFYYVLNQDAETPTARPSSTSIQYPNVDRADATKLEASSAIKKTAASQERKVWTAELGAGVKMDFMPIAAGSFQMGSNNGRSDEKPVHQVTFTKPFWLAKTEVTQAQFEQVMGRNPSNWKGSDLPVETVSWIDAIEFCKNLTALERQAGLLPAGYEYSLPTEAQWEYACRAGTTGAYAGDLDAMGWYDENSESQTHAVGGKEANAWGLYDMHGNVREWCSDWCWTYPSENVEDPSGPSSGSFRVFRSGAWGDEALHCRSAQRNGNGPLSTSSFQGFRPLVQSRPSEAIYLLNEKWE